MKNKVHIILASASVRRKDLMAEAGYDFDVVVSDVDESEFIQEGLCAAEYAKCLALAKAKDVAKSYPEALVIGADTVADFDGEIIGKPRDEKDAEAIMKKLFGWPHKVITGVAIVKLNDGVEIVESDTTVVYPKKLSDEQITEHINGGSWKGKAGAYAIQETGDEFVERIEGSITNVMGLGMELLEKMLNKLKITLAR